ncbi:MAG: hypothetical protein V1793_17375 [Pseudomonadota bacterium]
MLQKKTSVILMLLLSVLFLVSGCATISPKPGNVKEVGCANGNIQWDVAPEAEIQSFDCALGTHEGDPSLIYTVSIKNISDKAVRYRLTIFLDDMDKGVAYYVPIKGTPPAVKPGEVQKVTIPFMKTTVFSKKLSVTVKTLE